MFYARYAHIPILAGYIMKDHEKRVYKGSAQDFEDLIKLDPKVRLRQEARRIDAVIDRVENLRDYSVFFIGKIVADIKRDYPNLTISGICWGLSQYLISKLKPETLEKYWRLYQKLGTVSEYAFKRKISWRTLRYIVEISNHPSQIEFLVKQAIKHRWTVEDLKRQKGQFKSVREDLSGQVKSGFKPIKCLICGKRKGEERGKWFWVCDEHAKGKLVVKWHQKELA